LPQCATLFGKQLSGSKRPHVDLGCLKFHGFLRSKCVVGLALVTLLPKKYGKRRRVKKWCKLEIRKFFGTFRLAQSFISLEGAIAILGPPL
jgi:hypothetical protein